MQAGFGQKADFKSFQLCLLVFFDRTNLSEPNEHFFQLFESSLEVLRAKIKFSDNHGHNILKLYNILTQVRITTSKKKFDIKYSKLGGGVSSSVAERLKT